MSNKYVNILKYFNTLFLLLIVIKPIKNENNILLNNIIRIGDINSRYINFASYSNGDLIVETTAFPGNDKRMFYAIKLNGRPFLLARSFAAKYLICKTFNKPYSSEYSFFFSLALLVLQSLHLAS